MPAEVHFREAGDFQQSLDSVQNLFEAAEPQYFVIWVYCFLASASLLKARKNCSVASLAHPAMLMLVEVSLLLAVGLEQRPQSTKTKDWLRKVVS